MTSLLGASSAAPSGAITISHLRFGPRPIRSPYLIRSANFVACHQFSFLEKFEVLVLGRVHQSAVGG